MTPFLIGIIVVFLVVAIIGFVIKRPHSAEFHEQERKMGTGAGHTRAPAPAHAAKQKTGPAIKEPAPSGGVFRKEGLGAKLKELFSRGDGDETWKGLEDLLLRADLGPTASADIVARVRADFHHGARAGDCADRRAILLFPETPNTLT